MSWRMASALVCFGLGLMLNVSGASGDGDGQPVAGWCSYPTRVPSTVFCDGFESGDTLGWLPPTPQVVRLGQPCVQTFSTGMPGSAEGWEYSSTDEGRITVASGRLRMDDMIDNSVYSQNEAILHLDLLH